MERATSSQRASRLDAVIQLGELRRRHGRWAEAEELLAEAEFHPSAIVSRAMMHVAQGNPSAAWVAVRRLMLIVPTSNRLGRAAVLLPAVVSAVAAGDRLAACDAVEELQQIAARVGTDALRGSAAFATLATDDAANELWWSAVQSFHDAGLPRSVEKFEPPMTLTLAVTRTTASPNARCGCFAWSRLA